MILISIISVGGLAALFSVFLSIANQRFRVEEDPRVERVIGQLPGVNCGACGFASCRTLAEEIVGENTSVNSCVAGGNEIAQEIAGILGVESEAVQKEVAFVKCGARQGQRKKKASYVGVKGCQAADLIKGGELACDYGCFGYGDCQVACPFEAISIEEGLPEIDSGRCTGCGNCVKACPRNLISLEVFGVEDRYRVICSSFDKAKKARLACKSSCIGCGICVKVCPYDACEMKDNLAVIDQINCQRCGLCAEKCPTQAIREIGL